MTLIVDMQGVHKCSTVVYGGFEEYWSSLTGEPAPESHFAPSAANVAPRDGGWRPSRGPTQRPPLAGPGAGEEPRRAEPREPLFPLPLFGRRRDDHSPGGPSAPALAPV